MFSLNEAIEMLINKPMGLSFVWSGNENVHIFKDIDGEICKGEYGDGKIFLLKDPRVNGRYTAGKWKIDFKGSKHMIGKLY